MTSEATVAINYYRINSLNREEVLKNLLAAKDSLANLVFHNAIEANLRLIFDNDNVSIFLLSLAGQTVFSNDFAEFMKVPPRATQISSRRPLGVLSGRLRARKIARENLWRCKSSDSGRPGRSGLARGACPGKSGRVGAARAARARGVPRVLIG